MRRLMPLLAAAALVLSTAAARADFGDQLFKLLPDDGAEEDFFGQSVAISGTIAIVGANRDDDNGTNSGSAYLFDTTTGEQIAKLLPVDGLAGERFGESVAISGTNVIVGALHGLHPKGYSSGSAYLFDTTTGQQIYKLLAKDGEHSDNFGRSVAISGATAIVGAAGDDDNGDTSGSAYLFDITTGQQIAKLLPDDGAALDRFGWSVAISGTTAVVGALADDDNGTWSGSVYLFDSTTGQQIAKLLPDDGAELDAFGRSVAISGETILVGASGSGFGAAYVFDATTRKQVAKLLADDGAQGDSFGWSVGISGTTVIVGTNWPMSAYLLDITAGQQLAKLLPEDGLQGDYFGRAVAFSGATAIVGSYWDDDNGTDSGSAYLFDAAACPGDFDDDGVIGASDLAELLGAWGPNPDHAADLDGDGDVDAADLAELLGNWGPCP